MKRDMRKLNRVRYVAGVINAARRAGWSRSVEAWVHQGDTVACVVHLTMPETSSYHAGSVSFYFWRHWSRDGWTITSYSRYGERPGKMGLTKAEALLRSLSQWLGYDFEG